MRYFEQSVDGYIQTFGISDYGGEEITEERYNAIRGAMLNSPEETETVTWRLKKDLSWEAVSIEPVDPEIDEAEAFEILFGGAE